MWSDYIRERFPDINILKEEEGFATYKYFNLNNEKAVYIEDIYIKPEFRKLNLATSFSNKIQEIAKEQGCKYLLGTVSPEAKNATESLKVLLAHNMLLFKSEPNLIWLYKEIN